MSGLSSITRSSKKPRSLSKLVWFASPGRSREADALPFAVDVQGPGDVLHRPQGWLRLVVILAAFGHPHRDTALHQTAEHLLFALRYPANDNPAFTGIAQPWTVEGPRSPLHV